MGSVRNVGVVPTSTEEQGLFLLKKRSSKYLFYRSVINLAALLHSNHRLRSRQFNATVAQCIIKFDALPAAMLRLTLYTKSVV